jgi:hypothetical protein
MGLLEKKVLRRIYWTVAEQGIWRIRTDRELRELYEGLDIGADNKKGKSGMDRTSRKNGSWKSS